MEMEENRLVCQQTAQVIELPKQSNEQRIEQQQVKFRDLVPQLIASCLMYLLVIQAGINMSFSSILIPQLQKEPEFMMDNTKASELASIWAIALPIGALSSGFLMDKFGRKRAALLTCIPLIFAWLMVSFAKTLTMFYIFRVVSGISSGLTTISVVYVAEISLKSFRGVLLCLNSVWVSVGIFLTYSLNYFHLHWKIIGWIYTGISAMTILAIAIVPESPHWLMAFNNKKTDLEKRDQAKRSLSWLYRDNQLCSTQYKELIETHTINTQSTTQLSDDVGWIASLRKPQVYKPLIILLFLFLLQQLSGGYVLIFYTINIFRNLGHEFSANIDENLALVLVGAIRLSMALVAALMAQKCKRKSLMYLSTIGMGIFAAIVSIQMLKVDPSAQSIFLRQNIKSDVTVIPTEDSVASNYFLLICVLGYICFGSLGLFIIPWTLISELFSIKYKAKFGGATIAGAYILMFFILRIFPFALEAVSVSGIFAIFATMSFACAVFVHFFLPETHRKTFAEIEQYFLK